MDSLPHEEREAIIPSKASRPETIYQDALNYKVTREEKQTIFNKINQFRLRRITACDE